jgi:SsrA-binding protein
MRQKGCLLAAFVFMAEIVHNPKARRDYNILDTYEAGLVLRGSEVKALRAGKAQISDAFARVEENEVFLYNAHIDEYAFANRYGHAPISTRKLLLHKSEIRKLFALVSIKGNALVPLSMFWKNGKVKVSIGVGKGKVQFDKRHDIKDRENDRELKRATMHWMKSGNPKRGS